uniref:Guanine nucleotide exchange factor VAV2 n=1 Tax=Schistocephalus solidus TaxID=70667 RepID=A0A0X3PTS2_SCHSO
MLEAAVSLEMSENLLDLESVTHKKEDEVWRQCAEWLFRCRVLPADHPALSTDANALILLQALMNGVSLCHLLSNLSDGEVDPLTMKDFSPRPQQSQFLCCQNIRLFTHLCSDEFGIANNYLIEPSDLYQAKNFGKVIELLSVLSFCPRAQKTGIPGFPSADIDLQAPHEYYNNLEEIAASMDDMEIEAKSHYADIDECTKEMIYDTIVHGGPKISHSSSAEEQSSTPRACCIREIVSTEKNYVDSLKMLLEKYKYPLMKVLSAQEIDEIFKYIEDLHTIHRDLLSNINLATSSTVNFLRLGEVFIKVRDRLLIYGEYCGHLQKAQTLVTEILRNDVEKKTKIEICQSQSENYSKFHLTELLAVPIQRVLKYHLLLEQLWKLTDDDHPEKAELAESFGCMRELAQTINEVKRDLDTLSSIDQIQASIVEITLPPGKKLSSYGRRQIDGELRVLNHQDSKSKIRHVFLFDKALLLCKTRGDVFTFMAAYHIVKGTPQEFALPAKKGGKFPYEFILPIAGDREEVALTFFAKSEEARASWMRAAITVLDNLFPPGAKDNGYHFEMNTFKQTSYCCICRKLLQGCFYQGYRCRETGLAAHKACLPKVSQCLPPRYPSPIPPAPPLPPPIGNCTMRGRGGPQFRQVNGNGPPLNPVRPISRNPSSVSNDSDTPSAVCRPLNTTISSASASSTATTATTLSASNSFDADVFDDGLKSELSGTGGWSRPPISSYSQTLCTRRSPMSLASLAGSATSRQLITVTALKAYTGEPPPPPPIGISVKDVAAIHPLFFDVGDRISLLQPFEGSVWLQGRLNDREGWFPATHVEFANGERLPDGRSRFSLTEFSLTTREGEVLDMGGPDSLQATSSVSTPADLSAIWYFGEMDRSEATRLLTGCENGTFLVRISKNLQRMGEYSLSVVYNHPRHIRIQRTSPSTDSGVMYYLCRPQRFHSISALVEYYSRVSLNECFDEVQTCLTTPYQRLPETSVLFYARAIYDFDGSSNPRMLTLFKGDLVAVVSMKGDDRGWWKGRLNGKTGFFPMKFVVQEPTR